MNTTHCFTTASSIMRSRRILPFAIALLGAVALLISGCGEAEQPPPEKQMTSAEIEIYLTNKVPSVTSKGASERR